MEVAQNPVIITLNQKQKSIKRQLHIIQTAIIARFVRKKISIIINNWIIL